MELKMNAKICDNRFNKAAVKKKIYIRNPQY